MIGRRRLVLALSIAAAALPLCAQDLTVVSKTTVGDRAGTSTQYMTSTRSHSEIPAGYKKKPSPFTR
jgi:hypothetical protein